MNAGIAASPSINLQFRPQASAIILADNYPRVTAKMKLATIPPLY
jgi:hypothetical protein